jgi:hypothetical protein
MTSEVALGVAADSIDSASIKDGSVKFKDLNEEVADSIFNEITKGRELLFRDELDLMYRQPSSAAKIGIERGLSYSGADDLQGALRDLDVAIKQRDDRINAAELTHGVHEGKTGGVHGLGADENVVGTRKSQTLMGKTIASAHLTGDTTVAPGAKIDGYDVGASLGSINSTLVDINNIPGTVNDSKLPSNITRDNEWAGLSSNFYNHTHSGANGERGIYPGGIWFRSGSLDNRMFEEVPIDQSYSFSECQAIAALRRPSPTNQFNAADAVAVTKPDGLKVYQVTSGCVDGLCRVSYLIICARH